MVWACLPLSRTKVMMRQAILQNINIQRPVRFESIATGVVWLGGWSVGGRYDSGQPFHKIRIYIANNGQRVTSR